MPAKKSARNKSLAKNLDTSRSIVTIGSSRNIKSSLSTNFTDDSDIPFPQLITENCRKLGCEFDVICLKQYQKDYTIPKSSSRKRGDSTLLSTSTTRNTIAPAVKYQVGETENFITILTIHDSFERVVEVAFKKLEHIPIQLMKVLSVLVPLQNYLTRLTFERTNIHNYVLEELKKFLPLSKINEITFDRCVIQRNCDYSILLGPGINLKCLSLANCGICDVMCKKIAEKLHYNQPIEPTLGVLNLSTNCITDDGAKYFGECLRSNRHLRYLNLAGNRITDIGAAYIFESLVQFRLTREELYETRKRKFEYLKNKGDSPIVIIKKVKHDTKLKTSSATVLSLKIDKKVRRQSLSMVKIPKTSFDVFEDPFDKRVVIDKKVYNAGNFALCYLNLMYNNLSYLGLKKLVNVIKYQHEELSQSETGLIQVLIDGNNLPVQCDEYYVLNELLNKNISRCSGHTRFRRKSQIL